MCCPPQNLPKTLQTTAFSPQAYKSVCQHFRTFPLLACTSQQTITGTYKLCISLPYFPRKQGPVVEHRSCLLHISTISYCSLLPNFTSGCSQSLYDEWLKADNLVIGLLKHPSVQRQMVLHRVPFCTPHQCTNNKRKR